MWSSKYKEKYGSKYRKQLRNQHITNGECSDCGRKLPKSDTTIRKRCDICRQAEKANKDKKRVDRTTRNTCHTCNIRPQKPGRLRCQLCTYKANATQERRRTRLRDAGLCDKCGQEPFLPFVESGIHRGCVNRGAIWTTCRTCYLKRQSRVIFLTSHRWKELLAIFDTQGGKCSYTGKALVFGHNASIDHIQPVSRFPELKTDISNLEWVTDRVNTMKRDMTRDEFLTLTRTISDHT